MFHKHHNIALLGLPGIKEDETPVGITKLISLSQLWQIHLLESICLYIEKEKTDFNPSISNLHNSQMGAKLRDEFLQTRKWADISFTVEGMQHTLVKLNSWYGPNNEVIHSPITQLLGLYTTATRNAEECRFTLLVTCMSRLFTVNFRIKLSKQYTEVNNTLRGEV